MRRIKLIKDHKLGKKGEVVFVSPNVAFGLTDSGYGVVSKDMTSADYKSKTKTKKKVKHGDNPRLRPNDKS